MEWWKQALIGLGIVAAYYLICLAFFYVREWLNNRSFAEYDDYQDRAG